MIVSVRVEVGPSGLVTSTVRVGRLKYHGYERRAELESLKLLRQAFTPRPDNQPEHTKLKPIETEVAPDEKQAIK